MPKSDNTDPYHVSLRSPLRIKMGGNVVPVCAFDGHREFDSAPSGFPGYEFRTTCVYLYSDSSASIASFRRNIRVTLLVPLDNIAGMALQPFEEK